MDASANPDFEKLKQALLAKSLRLLARREYAERELRRKLEAGGADTDAVEAVIAHLLENNWLSDLRYAEILVRHRAGQGYGPIRITAELKQQGVERDLVRKAFAESGVDWFERAEATLNKRFRERPETPVELQKQKRYLMQRGFGFDEINEAIKADADEF
ncbi:regulatory protein RecX [Hahella sp. NBU794]|uniref:regulatory protein RecX n=1 Tax=Hahella sp. NBU794 TaxID=3422590 RepID=UPI003D6F3627